MVPRPQSGSGQWITHKNKGNTDSKGVLFRVKDYSWYLKYLTQSYIMFQFILEEPCKVEKTGDFFGFSEGN